MTLLQFISQVCPTKAEQQVQRQGAIQLLGSLCLFRTRRVIYLVEAPHRSDYGLTTTGNPGNVG
jgi:hypothetical protein